jgi:DNA-binding transcriptional MerR regulator
MSDAIKATAGCDILETINTISIDSPPPPKLYRIGEVIEYSGFSRQTIHNYTAMGLIRENQWTEKGHRLYDSNVFHRLAVIKELKEHFTLVQIKQALDQMPE